MLMIPLTLQSSWAAVEKLFAPINGLLGFAALALLLFFWGKFLFGKLRPGAGGSIKEALIATLIAAILLAPGPFGTAFAGLADKVLAAVGNAFTAIFK